MDKNEQEKEKIVQSFSKKVTPEVALLGQYVPVTKTKKFDLRGADKLQSNPFQKKKRLNSAFTMAIISVLIKMIIPKRNKKSFGEF